MENKDVKFLGNLIIDGDVQVAGNVEYKPTEGLAYELSEDGSYAICTGWGTSIDTVIVVAKYYNGCPVTHMGDSALSAANLYPYREISKIVFPDTITHLGKNCCRGLSWLKEVVLPLTIQSIGNEAFAACSQLESIKIGKQATYIGPNVFRNCSDITIYCEATEQPEGWDLNWNPLNLPVVWGCIIDPKDINDKIVQPLNALINITADDTGKVIEIADTGEIVLRTFEESSIKAYIDEYIAQALGGDY